MRRILLALPFALVLVAGAGCASKANNAAPPANPPTAPATTPPPTDAAVSTTPPRATPSRTPPAPVWPTPEDCVAYNPNNLTTHYEAGIWTVNDGSKEVLRLHGGPMELVGQQGLALAQRFRKHCYLGRNNTRPERNSYIFDYWRDSSGKTTGIPDQQDACSDYNRNNLTVEDMGGGDGWRVKDHDHVLHLFDNESDARNGKLVLAKYGTICFIGNAGDEDQGQDIVSYAP